MDECMYETTEARMDDLMNKQMKYGCLSEIYFCKTLDLIIHAPPKSELYFWSFCYQVT
jgi:hypothetical protein